MASLYCFPSFNSLSSHKLSFCPSRPSPYSRISHQGKCRYSTVVSLSKKPRASRRLKSDEELCNDIKGFLFSVGLPENHAPSTKELSQHGRQDLANIVRRRGYKFVRQLLDTSTSRNIDTGQTEILKVHSGSEGEYKNPKLELLDDDVLSHVANLEGDSNKETNEELKWKSQSSCVPESTTVSLQEKVAKFIQHGELDSVEGSGFGITNELLYNEAEDVEGAQQSEFAFIHQQLKDHSISSGVTKTLNGNVPSVPNVEAPASEHSDSRNSDSSTEDCRNTDSDKNLDIETDGDQDEIERLKFLLHQKEMQLTQLKQEIEKEKLALSVLQIKAETEITKAQKLISEKETELHVAEESLSGLKEVEIEYSGDGETVELAGSFNGWHHKIKMDLQPSSSTLDHTVSRTSRIWKAVLWLYPGVYEVKFVIDGHWRIDPQRESVNQAGVHNNILRVDR